MDETNIPSAEQKDVALESEALWEILFGYPTGRAHREAEQLLTPAIVGSNVGAYQQREVERIVRLEAFKRQVCSVRAVETQKFRVHDLTVHPGNARPGKVSARLPLMGYLRHWCSSIKREARRL